MQWFHLCSSDGPLHYIADTVYHMKTGNLEYVRSSAIWEDANEEQLLSESLLLERLPKLMEEFKNVVQSFEFIY